MLGIFKRSKKIESSNAGEPLSLKFKSGTEAFEYVCEYLDCSLHENAMLPALVLDASKEFGTNTAVKLQDDGTQLAVLRVASRDGGFVVLAATASADGPTLQPGQLVGWQTMKYAHDISNKTDDERFGWVGLIIGTLKPEYENGSWVGDKLFYI